MYRFVILASLGRSAVQVEPDFVANPEDRFSHDEAALYQKE